MKKRFLTLGIEIYTGTITQLGRHWIRYGRKISSQPVTMHRSDAQCGLHQKGLKTDPTVDFPLCVK